MSTQTLVQRQILVVEESERSPMLNLKRDDEIFEMVEKGVYPECLRLWVNQECLVRGITKSPKYGWYHEDLAQALKIPVYERTTGGGVVYHDEGNLNWSFYLRTNGSLLSPRKVFSEPAGYIVKALNQLGILGEFNPPNLITAGGRKVSGMAARASINILLVHGTLLFNSDLTKLEALCIAPPSQPPVANLTEWKKEIGFHDFARAIFDVLLSSGFEARRSDGKFDSL